MAQPARNSRHVLEVLKNHGMFCLLVMHALAQFHVPLAQFHELTEEEVEAVVTTREEDETKETEEEPKSPTGSSEEDEL